MEAVDMRTTPSWRRHTASSEQKVRRMFEDPSMPTPSKEIKHTLRSNFADALKNILTMYSDPELTDQGLKTVRSKADCMSARLAEHRTVTLGALPQSLRTGDRNELGQLATMLVEIDSILRMDLDNWPDFEEADKLFVRFDGLHDELQSLSSTLGVDVGLIFQELLGRANASGMGETVDISMYKWGLVDLEKTCSKEDVDRLVTTASDMVESIRVKMADENDLALGRTIIRSALDFSSRVRKLATQTGKDAALVFEDVFDDSSFTKGLRELNSIVWQLYDCMSSGSAGGDGEKTNIDHTFPYPHPINVAMFEMLVNGCFCEDDDGGAVPVFNYHAVETLLSQVCQPLLNIGTIDRHVATVKVAFLRYIRSPHPDLMEFISTTLANLLTEGDVAADEGSLESKDERIFDLTSRMLDYLNLRLSDIRIHMGLHPELLRGEVLAWANLRSRFQSLHDAGINIDRCAELLDPACARSHDRVGAEAWGSGALDLAAAVIRLAKLLRDVPEDLRLGAFEAEKERLMALKRKHLAAHAAWSDRRDMRARERARRERARRIGWVGGRDGLERALKAFYAEYDEEKLAQENLEGVKKLVGYYGTGDQLREDNLNERLREKYGEDLSAFVARRKMVLEGIPLDDADLDAEQADDAEPLANEEHAAEGDASFASDESSQINQTIEKMDVIGNKLQRSIDLATSGGLEGDQSGQQNDGHESTVDQNNGDSKEENDIGAPIRTLHASLRKLVVLTGGSKGVIGSVLQRRFGWPSSCDLSQSSVLSGVIGALQRQLDWARTTAELSPTDRLLHALVTSSSQKNYRRVAARVAQGTPMDLQHLILLAETIVSEVRADQVIWHGAFDGVYQAGDLALVGLLESTRRFWEDLKSIMDQELSVKDRVANLRVAVKIYPHICRLRSMLALNHFDELLGDDHIFTPLVEAWLAYQPFAFDEVLKRVLESERFESKPAHLHSDPVMDLFSMFSDKIKFFMELTLPHNPDDVAVLARDIHLPLGRYVNFIQSFLAPPKLPSHLMALSVAASSALPRSAAAGGSKGASSVRGFGGRGGGFEKLIGGDLSDALISGSANATNWLGVSTGRLKNQTKRWVNKQKLEMEQAYQKLIGLDLVATPRAEGSAAMAAKFKPSSPQDFYVMLYNLVYASKQVVHLRDYVGGKFQRYRRGGDDTTRPRSLSRVSHIRRTLSLACCHYPTNPGRL